MPGHTEIDTVVVIMFENRSFDHVLGHLSHPAFGGRAAVEGLGNPAATTRYDNVFDQQIYKPFPMQDGIFSHDPPHGRKTIATQLEVINQQATMRGFVKAYVQRTHSVVTEPPPMGFLVPSAVPVSGFLAAEYGVCNRWFAPLPAGTQPNRSMAFAGETLIDENAGLSIPNRGLVLDWLAQRRVRWRVYHSGLSFFVLFNSPHVLGPHFRSVRRLAQDFMDEPADKAPQVIFIEPEYDDSPVHFGFAPNDNHPPLQMGPGELFLHNIYAALTANPARWAKTLLVVTYDDTAASTTTSSPCGSPTYHPPARASGRRSRPRACVCQRWSPHPGSAGAAPSTRHSTTPRSCSFWRKTSPVGPSTIQRRSPAAASTASRAYPPFCPTRRAARTCRSRPRTPS